MKNLLITNENIFYVYGIISKILNGKTIISKHYYPNYKKLNINCNKIGFDNGFIITESISSKFKVVKSHCSKLSGKYYINLNNNVLDNGYFEFDFDWSLPTYKATVINVGEKITIKNNIIYLTKIEKDSSYNFKTPRKIIHKISTIC